MNTGLVWKLPFMKKILFLLTLLICCSQLLHAQDKIYRKNGKIVLCKVLEVGSSEVKYREANDPNGPIYILETDRIKKIVYENGKVETFKDDFRDPERYADDRNKALKVNFFSPLYGYFEMAYEKNMGYGKAYELSLGIIGAGKSEMIEYYNNQFGQIKRSPFGAFVSAGYKFGKLPDFILFGKSRASHLMQGTYVKPILYLGHYKENQVIDKGSIIEIGKQQVTFGALQLELGRQWVMGNKLLIDSYWGLGYGFDNKKDAYQYYNSSTNYYNDFAAFNYVNARLGKSPGLSYTFGIKVGMLLK